MSNQSNFTNRRFPPKPHPPRPVPPEPECGPLPGSLLRIFIPAGATINLLNLLEVTSPSGICLIVRIPILGENSAQSDTLSSLVNAVTNVGGSVEVM